MHESFLSCRTDHVTLYAGAETIRPFKFSLLSETSELLNGPLKSATFYHPSAICADPTRTGAYFITDDSTVRYSDGSNISFIAGDLKGDYGFRDGTRDAARFRGILGCVATSNAETLYVTDSKNHRVRNIDLKSGRVTTVGGNGESKNLDGEGRSSVYGDGGSSIFSPKKLVLFTSPIVQRDSVLFITSENAIRRLDIKSRQMTTVELRPEVSIDPFGIACTKSGTLIFSVEYSLHLYAADEKSGQWERLEMNDPDNAPYCGSNDLFVDEAGQRVWSAGYGLSFLHYITISPSFLLY
jgi:DNA-binding beta-propeller fold protein YncE